MSLPLFLNYTNDRRLRCFVTCVNASLYGYFYLDYRLCYRRSSRLGNHQPLKVRSSILCSGWIDLTIKGLALGGVYALIAMGYTMVYGILKMINFAHSEVFMSGPFTAVFVAVGFSNSGFLDRQPVIA